MLADATTAHDMQIEQNVDSQFSNSMMRNFMSPNGKQLILPVTIIYQLFSPIAPIDMQRQHQELLMQSQFNSMQGQ